MNEPKYLLDGSAVEVLEVLGSGKLLVARLYETFGEEDEVSVDLSAPFIVDRVFDNAPTRVLDERVGALEELIRQLEVKRTDLSQRLRESEAVAAANLVKLKRHTSLSRLMDFIDGKITHYVEDDWALPRIIEFKDSTTPNDDRERPERRRLRLLSLFGNSKGDLQWDLAEYSDGSGRATRVFPCCSYEEALEKVAEFFTKRFAENPRADVVERAEKFGVSVPAEYRAACVAMERKNLEGRSATLLAELEGINVKLALLK